jgi:hypothetical protein
MPTSLSMNATWSQGQKSRKLVFITCNHSSCTCITWWPLRVAWCSNEFPLTPDYWSWQWQLRSLLSLYQPSKCIEISFSYKIFPDVSAPAVRQDYVLAEYSQKYTTRINCKCKSLMTQFSTTGENNVHYLMRALRYGLRETFILSGIKIFTGVWEKASLDFSFIEHYFLLTGCSMIFSSSY